MLQLQNYIISAFFITLVSNYNSRFIICTLDTLGTTDVLIAG